MDPKVGPGQGHSLAVCCCLAEWFGQDPTHCLKFMAVCSTSKWALHNEVHELALDCNLRQPFGEGPKASLNWLRKHAADSCINEWRRLFSTLTEYRGKDFLTLLGEKEKPIQPSYLHGGAWLSSLQDRALCVCVCRGILNHAPIGSYRAQFNIDGGDSSCPCGSPMESRAHILASCGRFMQGRLGSAPYSLDRFVLFCRENPLAFLFGNPPDGG